MTQVAVLSPEAISGRYTLAELYQFIVPLDWSGGVPETVDMEAHQGLQALLQQVAEYLDRTPGAVAVDIVEGQVLNVVTHRCSAEDAV